MQLAAFVSHLRAEVDAKSHEQDTLKPGAA
jgi:hypothetical protein